MTVAVTFTNTPQTYGGVTKIFHWLTALLILTAFPLGLIAHELPYDTSEQLAFKAMLFSVHKTIGITAFFVALARILWALTQPKPGLLHPDRKLEAFAAEAVHWLLYGSMVIVPLSGWIHHAATEGFAPIWWPFGQNLIFVPKSVAVAEFFGTWHDVFTKVFAASLFLHIAGAIKHHVIDKDATLRRMLPGRTAAEVPAQSHDRAPFWTALLVWSVVIGGASALAMLEHSDDHAPAVAELQAVASDWQVQDGTLEISVRQFGSAVKGGFESWTAAITFDPEAEGEVLGNVTVDIAIGSMSIGTVTAQALGGSYLDAGTFPTAQFVADIKRAETGYVAEGDLTLVGQTAPLSLPFTLTLDGDLATMQGETVIDRRDYGIGMIAQKDEANLGFPVNVSVNLTALRGDSD